MLAKSAVRKIVAEMIALDVCEAPLKRRFAEWRSQLFLSGCILRRT
jgi:hypothetical protein